MRFFNGMILALALATFGHAGRSVALNFVVDTTGDTQDTSPGDGTCEDSGGACSLRAAIEEANGGASADTISFSVTTPATITLDSAGLGELSIQQPLSIDGPGSADLIVQADAAPNTATSRVLRVGAGITVTIDDITIRHGNLVVVNEEGGGGIISAGNLTLERVVVADNRAISPNFGEVRGGGIFTVSQSGSLTVRDSTISGNTGQGGTGGICRGGGFFISRDVNAVFQRCTISGNNAFGGDEPDSPGNASGGGGAMHLFFGFGGSLRMTNCTISGNLVRGGLGTSFRAFGRAGGIVGNGSGGVHHTTLESCTITANAAEGNTSQAGGIQALTSSDNQGVRIVNCIVQGNTSEENGDDIQGNILSGGFNIIGDTTGGTIDQSGTGLDGRGNVSTGDQIGADPMLGPLQDNGGFGQTHALADTSVAFDTGTANDADGSPLATDQRGTNRPQGAGADIGAFELFVIPVELSGFDID